MQEELEVRIVGVREATRVTPEGRVELMMIVEYMVGPHGPFSVEIAKAEYTAQLARELVEKEARETIELLR